MFVNLTDQPNDTRKLRFAPRLRTLLASALLSLTCLGTAQSQSVAQSEEVSAPPILINAEDARPVPFSNRALIHLGTVEDSGLPVLGAKRNGPAHRHLRQLYASGQAAGNIGDFYENRDRGHSGIPPQQHPQITHIHYDDQIRSHEADYGLAAQLMFDAPVIGNSSTAIKSGPIARSLPRLALTAPDGQLAINLYQNYLTGQIHVYPEHRDHDPSFGDLFPANTPYYLISQGSSGSDRPHLEALAMILAAFRPETKARLLETGLLASTVQMIFRRGQEGILSRAAYLSGAAHPTVFPGDRINLMGLVTLANSVLPEDIPPMVWLEVVEETAARPGIEYFGDGLSERLFDTPSAIARVWRSNTYRRSMVVSASTTTDVNGRELTFTWALLRGDPARTHIEPLDPAGSRARVTLDWQEPRPAPGRPDIQSARIDIGVFAHNGVHDSAPAFISFLLPQHELRRYEAGPDGRMRIASLDRWPENHSYADPLLFPETSWRDEFRYTADGSSLGWQRHRETGVTTFDAEGARLSAAQDPSADRTTVTYPVAQVSNGSWMVTEMPH